MRLAIVGDGKAAREKHVPAIADTPGIDLVAVAGPHGGIDGLPWFPSIDALIGSDTEFDAVALCGPPQERRHQATLALESGRHVLLEKPPGVTVSEINGLSDMARRANLTLFTSWHARYAKAVEQARAIIVTHGASSIEITWRENVRARRPDQDWIWQPGGLGVLDLGVSALSVLTEIVPEQLFVTGAELSIPSNRSTPIAATVSLTGQSGLQVSATFDFRQVRDELWEIEVQSDAGIFALSQGGSLLTMGGRILACGPLNKYRGIYSRFLQLVHDGASEVDTTPLAHVADVFLLGRRIIVEPFED